MDKPTLKKKIIVIIGILFFVFAFFCIHMGTTVYKNIQKMNGAYSTTTYFPPYPPINTANKTPAQIAEIMRGEYLVKVGDCIACHTDTTHKGPSLAGGLLMQTPYGTIYTPNITPDKKTGIGTWTDEQFIKAMREGISPQGEYYYPAFPFLYFNQATLSDVKAIKAYLDHIPAVEKKNLENDMMWPFNWRFIQLGWRILFFYPNENGPLKEDPKKSTKWNRGAYLVEGLGHCAMCHTPSYALFDPDLSVAAPIRKYNLTGANVQGYLAPNITKTNLGGIPDDELMEVFTENHLLGGGNVKGPMVEAIHDSLMQLTKEDLLAIITYLKTVESTLPPQAAYGTSGVGESIYNSYCSGCHATGVGGAPRMGDAGSWKLLSTSMDHLYRIAIRGGGNMPAKGTCLNCSNSDIAKAVDYMVATTLQGIPISKQPAKPSMYNGKEIYEAHCSRCHSEDIIDVPQMGDRDAWKSIEAEGFIKAYQAIVTGSKGHPDHGGCPECSDAELLSAVKYLMHESSSNKNYILW